MSTLDIVLSGIFAVVEVLTLAWGIREYLKNRDFKAKAEVWLRNAQGIANACIVLKDHCEQGKVSSVKDAGGRADTIGSDAYSLFTSIKDALRLKD